MCDKAKIRAETKLLIKVYIKSNLLVTSFMITYIHHRVPDQLKLTAGIVPNFIHTSCILFGSQSYLRL